jgi:hypothetical protein
VGQIGIEEYQNRAQWSMILATQLVRSDASNHIRGFIRVLFSAPGSQEEPGAQDKACIAALRRLVDLKYVTSRVCLCICVCLLRRSASI